MEQYSAIKGRRFEHPTSWKDLENVMLTRRIQTQNVAYRVIVLEGNVENQPVCGDGQQSSSCGGRRSGERGGPAQGYRLPFWGDENVLNELVVLVAQPCEETAGVPGQPP